MDKWKIYDKFRGRSGDGNMIISNEAKLDESIPVAIRIFNEWGGGDLGYVKLITDEAYQLKKTHAELKVSWDRLDRYINRHPDPDMTIVAKVTKNFDENKDMHIAQAITLANSAIKSAESAFKEMARNPCALGTGLNCHIL